MPLPITVHVIPVPDNSVTIPPMIVSIVTAVSASNGVGTGRTAFISALVATVSSSSTSIV